MHGEHHDDDKLYDIITSKKKKKSLSPSGLTNFLGCELRYYFEYIKKWRVSSRSPQMACGTAFHAAQEMHNVAKVNGEEIKKQDLFHEFEMVWDTETEGMVLGEDYKKQYLFDNSRLIGLDLVERAWNSHILKGLTPIKHLRPYSTWWAPAVELNVEAPIINIATGKPYPSTDDWSVMGFIDLLAQGTKDTNHYLKGDLGVIDYKTAAQEWGEFDVNINLQLLMYAYTIRYILRNENMFPNLAGKDKEDVVGIICMHKKKISKKGEDNKWGVVRPYFVRVEDAEIDYLENLLVNAIEKIDGDREDIHKFFPNPDKMGCGYCSFKEPCLALRRGATEDDLKEWEKKNKHTFRKWKP